LEFLKGLSKVYLLFSLLPLLISSSAANGGTSKQDVDEQGVSEDDSNTAAALAVVVNTDAATVNLIIQECVVHCIYVCFFVVVSLDGLRCGAVRQKLLSIPSEANVFPFKRVSVSE